MRLILIGPPNAGKGTQAHLLTSWFDIPHISTGNILRQRISDRTTLGEMARPYVEQGLLVPDELVKELVNDALSSLDLDRGFLFDGYPRTIAQAENLDHLLESKKHPLDRVVLLEVDDNVLIERATGRRVCPVCGATYHVKFHPPRKQGICERDGTTLTIRKDDQVETVRARIDIYNKQTSPLVDYFEGKGLLLRIPGERTPQEIFDDIVRILGERE